MRKWGPVKGLCLGIANRIDSLLGRLAAALGLLGQKDGLDVGQDTSLGNGDSREQFVQLLVVTDGQLKMTGDDPCLLVVTGSVSCELENLSCQVLHDSGQVHGCTGSDPLTIVSLAEMTVDTSNGELQTGPGRPGLALSLCLSSLTTSRHVDRVCVLPATSNTTMPHFGVSLFYITQTGRF